MNRAFFFSIASIVFSGSLFGACFKLNKSPWNPTGSFLYWYAKEQGIGYTNEPANVLTHDNFTSNSVINPSFSWEPGLRLGLGYTKSNRRWSFRTEWIYLPSKADGSKRVNSGAPNFAGTYPIWSMGPDTLVGDYVSSSSSHWHLVSNILDVYAQYHSPCFFRCLELLPFVGARGSFLNQKLKVKYSGGTFFNGIDVNTLHSHYHAAGPRVGLDAECFIAYGLCLFGRGAASPLFGDIFMKQKEMYLARERFHRSHDHYHFVLSTDYAFGLKWQREAIRKKLYTTLSVAWEGELFFYANSFYRGPHHFFSDNRHLFLQGLTFTFGLDF